MNTFILLTAAFEWYIHILIRSSDFIAVCIILSVSPESMKLIVKKQGKVLHDIESMTSVRDSKNIKNIFFMIRFLHLFEVYCQTY